MKQTHLANLAKPLDVHPGYVTDPSTHVCRPHAPYDAIAHRDRSTVVHASVSPSLSPLLVPQHVCNVCGTVCP